MAYNNGLARKQFEVKQKALRNEYQKLGMSEEQIKKIQEFDLEQQKSNRRFYEHTQSLLTSDCGYDDDGDDGKSVLLEKFSEALSVSSDDSSEHSRYWWIEEIDTPELAKRLKTLSSEDIELLTLYVFDKQTQTQLASFYGISQKNISKKLIRIKKYLSVGV